MMNDRIKSIITPYTRRFSDYSLCWRLACLIVATVMLVLVPSSLVKIAASGVLICLGMSCQMSWRNGLWRSGYALAWGASFLLVPMGYYFFPQNAVMAIAITFLGGLLWVAAAGIGNHPPRLWRHSPGIAGMMVAGALVLLLYGPSMASGISHGGDEHFHWTCMELYREQLYVYMVLGRPRIIILMAIAIMGTCIGIDIKQRRLFLSQWVLPLTILIACCLLSFDSAGMSQPKANEVFREGRASRFPVLQPWISAAINQLFVRDWSGFTFYSVSSAYCRLVPVMSIFSLVLVLVSDRRWRHFLFLIPLPLVAILTIPSVFFHANLIYLDIPVVIVMTFLLFQAKNVLARPARTLRSSPVWWLLVLGGFLKESIIPTLALITACRAFVCVYRFRDNFRVLSKELVSEGTIAVAMYLPILIHLYFRSKMGMRPFGYCWGNLISLSLWWKSLCPLLNQLGPIIALSLIGLVSLIYQRRYAHAFFAVALFVGMKAFFVFDSDLYIDLARFNLYLVPSTIFLAWEGCYTLVRRSLYILPALTIPVIIVNLCLTPIGLAGERHYWEAAPEKWYGFRQCAYDLKSARPTRILLANFALEPPVTAEFIQAGWNTAPQFIFAKVATGKTNNEMLKRELEYANENGCQTIITRYDGQAPPFPVGERFGPFQLVKVYPCDQAGLMLFLLREPLERE